MSRLPICIVFVALAGATGCVFSAEPVPGPRPSAPAEETGMVTIEWGIAGAPNSRSCDRFGAVDALIVVRDLDGNELAREKAPCEDFSATMDLPVGTYDISVTLVDEDDRSVSLTLPLDDVKVIAGTNLKISTDFPVRSML